MSGMAADEPSIISAGVVLVDEIVSEGGELGVFGPFGPVPSS